MQCVFRRRLGYLRQYRLKQLSNEVERTDPQLRRIEKLRALLEAASAAGDNENAFSAAAAEAIECDVVIEIHKLLVGNLIPMHLDRSDLATILKHTEYARAVVSLCVMLLALALTCMLQLLGRARGRRLSFYAGGDTAQTGAALQQ